MTIRPLNTGLSLGIYRPCGALDHLPEKAFTLGTYLVIFRKLFNHQPDLNVPELARFLLLANLDLAI